jgi:hypothetical protein
MESENRVDETEAVFAPRFVEAKASFDYAGGTDTSLVCTNCGLILPVGTEQAELTNHLSKCVPNEIKSPYKWAILPGVIENVEDTAVTGYHLICNGNIILKAPTVDYFPDISSLKAHQPSPFEVVTEEYLYKYEFLVQLHSGAEWLRKAIDEALTVVGDLNVVISRGRPYLDNAAYQRYMRDVRKIGSALNEALTSVPE